MGNEPVVEWQRDIHIRVYRIEAYQQEFQEIGCGMTCGLWVEFDEDPGDLDRLILGVEGDIEQAVGWEPISMGDH